VTLFAIPPRFGGERESLADASEVLVCAEENWPSLMTREEFVRPSLRGFIASDAEPVVVPTNALASTP
jgi:hypothetical protein